MRITINRNKNSFSLRLASASKVEWTLRLENVCTIIYSYIKTKQSTMFSTLI